jgi:hypothetical protein
MERASLLESDEVEEIEGTAYISEVLEVTKTTTVLDVSQ